jgi:GT2 family glycosyltransferase
VPVSQLGIGVITYNRKARVLETLKFVVAYTRTDHILVVADDGSTDGTVDAVRQSGWRCITGNNSGVAANKNRALFYLQEINPCDRIILLEDDTIPTVSGWDQSWVAAIDKWGHVNIASDAHMGFSVGGTGTLDDPMMCTVISAQCSGFSREAIAFVGFFDPRYGKYGGEHVEHSRRLLRAGYGGTKVLFNGGLVDGFYGLRGALAVHSDESFGSSDDRAYAALITDIVSDNPLFRAAYYNDSGLHRLRNEIKESERGDCSTCGAIDLSVASP